jgi:hypothetical protein
MNGIIEFIFKLIFPKAPGWISTLLTTAIPSVLSLVEAIDDAAEKTGAEKFEFVVREVREMLDDSLDSLPEWGEISEEARDRILGGLVEFAVFVHKVAEDESPRKARRKVRRAIKRIGK